MSAGSLKNEINYIEGNKIPLAVRKTEHLLLNLLKSPSSHNIPIENTGERLKGKSRAWGDASPTTKNTIIKLIRDCASELSTEDQAILLAIARIESGFNPDAAAKTTSASGVFQIVKRTAAGLGLDWSKRFDAKTNILAGIALFKENMARVQKNYPALRGEQRAIMLYALHHDGPSLKYGGAEIAKRELVPYLRSYQERG